MNIATKIDFLPGKKTLLSFGLAALTFVGHALATLLLDQFAPGNAAAEMLIDQVAAYGYAASGIGAVYGLSAKALRKMGVSKAAPVLLACLGLGWFVTGCGGQLTVAECQSRVEQAKVAKLGCTYFPEEPDRLKCEHSADIAVAAAMLGCEWADRPPAEEAV